MEKKYFLSKTVIFISIMFVVLAGCEFSEDSSLNFDRNMPDSGDRDSVESVTFLTAPGDLKVTTGDYKNMIKLTWGQVDGAKYYTVYRSDSLHGEFRRISYLITDTVWENSVIKTDKWYFYRVRAMSEDRRVESGFSMPQGGYAGNSPSIYLDMPVISSISEGYPDKIELTWNQVSGADYYKVYRSAQLDEGYILISEKINKTQFIDNDPIVDKWSYYKIMAVSSVMENSYSEPGRGYAGEKPQKPAIPTGVSASDRVYENYIQITWNEDKSAQYYVVYRSETEDGYFEEIKRGVYGNSYEDRNVPDDDYYYYKIQAFSNGLGSTKSSAVAGAIREIHEIKVSDASEFISGAYADSRHHYVFNNNNSFIMHAQNNRDYSAGSYHGVWSYYNNRLIMTGKREEWGWGYGKVEPLHRKFQITIKKEFDSVYNFDADNKLVLTGKRKTEDTVSFEGTYGYRYSVEKKVRVWSWFLSKSWGWWDDYSYEKNIYECRLTVKHNRDWEAVYYRNGFLENRKRGTIRNDDDIELRKVNGEYFISLNEDYILPY